MVSIITPLVNSSLGGRDTHTSMHTHVHTHITQCIQTFADTLRNQVRAGLHVPVLTIPYTYEFCDYCDLNVLAKIEASTDF